MNLIKIVCLFLFCSLFLHAKKLPIEPRLVSGTLDNGLSYTIRKNEKPENKATLRLLVKVGSLEEDDDQKGVAHLVEHLAFNGTKHFKGTQLIEFLESIGVAFGSHLNALTNTALTLYKLEVPLEKDNLEKSMLIFSDWAGNVSITKEELDKERGIIVEEARSKYSANFRLYLQYKNYVYANSKYKDRTPIGDMDIIRNISLKRVQDFYNDWYRPENMHFVIVGDFDVKKIETMIKKYFSKHKNKSQRQRVSRDVPLIDGTRFAFLHDKELEQSKLRISLSENYDKIDNEKKFKEALIRTIAVKLFNRKASENSLKNNPAAKSIFMGSRRFTSNLRNHSFYTTYTKDKEIKAFKEVINSIYEAKQNGFSKKELEEVKKQIRTTNKEDLKQLYDLNSSQYADRIIGYSLYNDLYVDEKYRLELANKQLLDVSLEEVNKIYRQMLSSKNILISFYSATDKKHLEKNLRTVLKNAQDKKYKKKKEKALPNEIDTSYLKAKKIMHESFDKKYKVHEFTLENGVKVVFKKSNYNENSIILKAISKGGYSQLEKKYIPAARYASAVIFKSGLDKYDSVEIQKIYANKSVSLNPNISRYNESISGNSTRKNFKYLLQGVYLFATKYKIDETMLNNIKINAKEALTNQEKVPKRVFDKEYTSFLYDKNKYYELTAKEDVENLKKEDLLKVYKESFSDFNNFIFLIVGDISYEEVKKHSALYLANLPIDKSKKEAKNKTKTFKEGKHKFVKNYNNENISSLRLEYTKPMTYSLGDSIKLSALRSVLNTRLREYIREEKSGVYGIRVNTKFLKEPKEEIRISISFKCDPKRRKELIKYVKSIIEDIKTKEVEEKYITAYKKKKQTQIKEYKKRPEFWLSQLNRKYYYGESLERIDLYKKEYEKINAKILKQSAQIFLNTDNIIYSELNPKQK